MARTPEQNEQMRNESKEKIRAAALNQFAKKGLFATRIKDIAKDAGVSQGLFYRYYTSKDDVYIDLINDALEKLNAASHYVNSLEVSAQEKIIQSLTELFKTIESSDSFRQTCRLITQAMNSTAIPAEAQSLLDKKRDVPYQVFAEIMQQGQDEDSVVEGDPYNLAVLFWSTVNGLATFYATRATSRPLPDKEFIERMFLKKRS